MNEFLCLPLRVSTPTTAIIGDKIFRISNNFSSSVRETAASARLYNLSLPRHGVSVPGIKGKNMPNSTQNYLLANTPLSNICFSGTTGTTSVYLNGPGGVAGDGIPMSRRGWLTQLCLWDGNTLRNDINQISFNSGDRVSLYCQNTGTDFTLKVRVNGVSTSLQIASVPHNSTLQAVLEFMLVRT